MLLSRPLSIGLFAIALVFSLHAAPVGMDLVEVDNRDPTKTEGDDLAFKFFGRNGVLLKTPAQVELSWKRVLWGDNHLIQGLVQENDVLCAGTICEFGNTSSTYNVAPADEPTRSPKLQYEFTGRRSLSVRLGIMTHGEIARVRLERKVGTAWERIMLPGPSAVAGDMEINTYAPSVVTDKARDSFSVFHDFVVSTALDPAQTYRVEVRATGETAGGSHWPRRDGSLMGRRINIDGFRVADYAMRTLSGTVRWTGSSPTPLYGVKLTINSDVGPVLENDRTVFYSDGNGRFLLSGLNPGTYEVTAQSSRAINWTGSVEIAAGSDPAPLIIEAPKPYTIDMPRAMTAAVVAAGDELPVEVNAPSEATNFEVALRNADVRRVLTVPSNTISNQIWLGTRPGKLLRPILPAATALNRVPADLWDIEVSFNVGAVRHTLIEPRAVKVIPAHETNFYLLHLTDPHLGKSENRPKFEAGLGSANFTGVRFIPMTGDYTHNTGVPANAADFASAITMSENALVASTGDHDNDNIPNGTHSFVGSYSHKWYERWIGQYLYRTKIGPIAMWVHDTRSRDTDWVAGNFDSSLKEPELSDPSLRIRMMIDHDLDDNGDNRGGHIPPGFVEELTGEPFLKLQGHTHQDQGSRNNNNLWYSTYATTETAPVRGRFVRFNRSASGAWWLDSTTEDDSPEASTRLASGTTVGSYLLQRTLPSPNNGTLNGGVVRLVNNTTQELPDAPARVVLRRGRYRVDGPGRIVDAYDSDDGQRTILQLAFDSRPNSTIDLTISATSANAAPVAQDHYVLMEPGTEALVWVADMARDPDNAPHQLKVLEVTQPIQGEASVVQGGRAIRFVPTGAIQGEIRVPFILSDGASSSTSTLVLVVANRPGSDPFLGGREFAGQNISPDTTPANLSRGRSRPIGAEGLYLTSSGLGLAGAASGGRDGIRFVGRSEAEGFRHETELAGFLGEGSAASAGIMARASIASDSPFVAVTARRDGTVVLLHRATAGGPVVTGNSVPGLAWPVKVRLERAGSRLFAAYADANGGWVSLGEAASPATGALQVGAFLSSGGTSRTISAAFTRHVRQVLRTDGLANTSGLFASSGAWQVDTTAASARGDSHALCRTGTATSSITFKALGLTEAQIVAYGQTEAELAGVSYEVSPNSSNWTPLIPVVAQRSTTGAGIHRQRASLRPPAGSRFVRVTVSGGNSTWPQIGQVSLIGSQVDEVNDASEMAVASGYSKDSGNKGQLEWDVARLMRSSSATNAIFEWELPALAGFRAKAYVRTDTSGGPAGTLDNNGWTFLASSDGTSWTPVAATRTTSVTTFGPQWKRSVFSPAQALPAGTRRLRLTISSAAGLHWKTQLSRIEFVAPGLGDGYEPALAPAALPPPETALHPHHRRLNLDNVPVGGASQDSAELASRWRLSGRGRGWTGSSGEAFAWSAERRLGTHWRATLAVSELQAQANDARAGLMARTSATDGAPFVALSLDRESRLRLEVRTSTGAARQVVGTDVLNVSTPVWLRLERDGVLFRPSWSADGVSFTSLPAVMVSALAVPGLAGPCVAGGAEGAEARLIFSGLDFEEKTVDALSDLALVSESTSGWNAVAAPISHSDATWLEPDGAAARTLAYHGIDHTDFHLRVLHQGTGLSRLTLGRSGESGTYTSVAVQTVSSQTFPNGWTETILKPATAVPLGTHRLQVSAAAGSSRVLLGEASLWQLARDQAGDFTRMTGSEANLVIDAANPEYFFGDTGRIRRTGTDVARELVYRTPGLRRLEVIAVAKTSLAPSAWIQAQAEAANGARTTLPLDVRESADAGGGWTRFRFETADVAPAGTRQVAVRLLGGTTDAYRTQVALVRFSAGRDAAGGFSSWMADHPEASGTAATDDADGDGVPNLLEFALGLDPSRADSVAATPALAREPDGSLALQLETSATATGLRWVLEGSDDLQTWTEVPAEFTWTEVPGGRLKLEARESPGTGGGPRRFLRIRVSLD